MAGKEDTGFVTVFVTASSLDEASRIARTMVEERLAACGNIIPQLRSIYRWQDEIHDEPEVLLVLKTSSALFESLRSRVLELHSYDVPEIIALPVEAGHEPYLDWIVENTKS